MRKAGAEIVGAQWCRLMPERRTRLTGKRGTFVAGRRASEKRRAWQVGSGRRGQQIRGRQAFNGDLTRTDCVHSISQVFLTVYVFTQRSDAGRRENTKQRTALALQGLKKMRTPSAPQRPSLPKYRRLCTSKWSRKWATMTLPRQ